MTKWHYNYWISTIKINKNFHFCACHIWLYFALIICVSKYQGNIYMCEFFPNFLPLQNCIFRFKNKGTYTHPCPPKLEWRELHLIWLCCQSIIGQQSDISWTNRLIFNQGGIRNSNETLQPTQTYKGINTESAFDSRASVLCPFYKN
jgi:hypothetical protein